MGHSKGFGQLDLCEKKKTHLLVSDQGFTPTLFSAKKRVKNPHYLHMYNRAYRKCLYKGERRAACALGTPRPRDAQGQTGVVVEPQAGSSETRSETEQGRDPGEGLQRRLGPTAQKWGGGNGRAELPEMACGNTRTRGGRRAACAPTDCAGMR